MWKHTIVLCCWFALTIADTYPPLMTPRCPQNEVFIQCRRCENTCASPEAVAKCTLPCKPGCVCKKGLFRNSQGICVEPKLCDSCKMNEVFDACLNNGCENSCDEPQRRLVCLAKDCIAGCICQQGFVRNYAEFCVAVEHCDINCTRPNEQFSICGNECEKSCKNKDEPLVCTAECKTPSCTCKDGFVRDWDGNCIRPEECPSCSGPNEFFSCGSPCDRECATLGETCPLIPIKCVPRCYCKEGFARNNKNICIPIEQCPPRQCKTDPNAIIVPCGDPCPLTCDNKDETGPRPCPKICIINGCKCKNGYVLDKKDGKCIPTRKCPPKQTICSKNEIFSNRIPSCPPERTCVQHMEGFEYDCMPNVTFRSGCICKQNYLRNDKKQCVLPAQCCTDPNSVFVAKPNPCNGGTCEKPEFDPCDDGPRPFGCQCKPGFLKKSATNSTCVPKASCKQY